VALAGQYNPLDRPLYIGDVCPVDKVGLGTQYILGGPEFTDWESKFNAGTYLVLGFSTKMLGKCHTLHTKEAHEKYLMSKSLISRLAGRENKAQQLILAGLALSSIWEKARARDR
jgi:hypothetical protein